MEHLLIIGASTRAAAMSAIRAGYRPWCADLFADRDLQKVCHVECIPWSEYPQAFVDIAHRAPPGPWMYTGGLENHPKLVQEISKQRPLLGTPANVLREVRSPFAVAECLKNAELASAPVRDGIQGLTPDRRWLVKPAKGTGGRGITFWSGEPLKRGYYLQKFLKGDAISAIFVAQQGTAAFYGATRQLVGEDWLHAAPFHYCGSIGPVPSMESAFAPIGRELASRFDLRGVFGVDCIVRDGIPCVIEVNPRYTASVEVLERSGRPPVLCFGGERVPSAEKVFGKAVLYARDRFAFPKTGPWDDASAFADIPQPDQVIEPGKPILTLFAEAESDKACETKLRDRAAHVERLVFMK